MVRSHVVVRMGKICGLFRLFVGLFAFIVNDAGGGSVSAAETDGNLSVDDSRCLLLVTLDGLRPEELFTGADRRLIDKEIGGVELPQEVLNRFWDEDPKARREKLMPFFWQVIARHGQVFGDPAASSAVKVTNGRYFSYPGYQEILCGFPDDEIDSNDKQHNRNVSVLEWLHQRSGFAGQVAAFASWDVFPFILNQPRSGIYVNAGWQDLDVVASQERRDLLNQGQRELPHFWSGVRWDHITFAGAMEYLQVKEPRVLYLALGETDDWCHSERYDLYLDAARRADAYLRTLWEFVQQSPRYRGKTSMLITTDHGRGDGREGWKNHNADLPGSDRIWIGVMGPHTPPLGVREAVQATQAQVAASAALLLNHDYTSASAKIAEPLPDIVEE